MKKWITKIIFYALKNFNKIRLQNVQSALRFNNTHHYTWNDLIKQE